MARASKPSIDEKLEEQAHYFMWLIKEMPTLNAMGKQESSSFKLTLFSCTHKDIHTS